MCYCFVQHVNRIHIEMDGPTCLKARMGQFLGWTKTCRYPFAASKELSIVLSNMSMDFCAGQQNTHRQLSLFREHIPCFTHGALLLGAQGILIMIIEMERPTCLKARMGQFWGWAKTWWYPCAASKELSQLFVEASSLMQQMLEYWCD